MRRIKILFFWLFCNKNNISFIELLQFLVKPTIKQFSKKHILKIEEGQELEVYFKNISNKLYWPKSYSLFSLYQVTSETLDKNDWHYYQKKHTEVAPGEILLDIGTAEGLFPLTVINRCDHIYLIEPGKTFYDCLHKTFAAYLDKVTIMNTAVGNKDGIISFNENSLEGMISDEKLDEGSAMGISKIDSIFANGQKITFLKADIEGFEEEMLKGAEQTIKANKPKIAITCYHTQNNPDTIIAIIKGFVPEYNYYVKGIYGITPKPVLIHFWI